MTLPPRRALRSTSVVGAALCSMLAACGDPAGPPPIPACEAPVTVTVGPGSTPEFDWSPACRVEVLSVETLSDGMTTWFVIADPASRRAIAPPIRYGVVPAEALDLTVGVGLDLQTGTRYEVTLIINESPGGDVVVGRAEFVP